MSSASIGSLEGREIAAESLEEGSQQNHRADPIIDGGGDEDETFILVPEPGLPSISINDYLCNHVAFNAQKAKLRRAPNECSICLCEYSAGSDVVWSSNPQCEHVFHETCIEQWLMKQRGGPLCPCCRRDFVIDPFDLGQDEEDAAGDIEGGVTHSYSEPMPNSLQLSEDVGNEETIAGGTYLTLTPGDINNESSRTIGSRSDERFLDDTRV